MAKVLRLDASGRLVEADAGALYQPTVYTAGTLGQTVIPIVHTPGALMVYRAGVLIYDYAETSTNITLDNGLIYAGEPIVLIKWDTFDVANCLPLGGTAYDSSRLNGQLAAYYASQTDLSTLGANRSQIVQTALISVTGTSTDIPSLPSYIKRLTMNISGIATNGSSPPMIQLGTSSGFATTGYAGSTTGATTSVVTTAHSSGFLLAPTGGWAAGNIAIGSLQLTQIVTDVWIGFGFIGKAGVAFTASIAGQEALASALTRLRLTTVNGTDLFTSGAINCIYEGTPP